MRSNSHCKTLVPKFLLIPLPLNPQTIETYRAALLFCTFLGEGRGFTIKFFTIFGIINPREAAVTLGALDLRDLETKNGSWWNIYTTLTNVQQQPSLLCSSNHNNRQLWKLFDHRRPLASQTSWWLSGSSILVGFLSFWCPFRCQMLISWYVFGIVGWHIASDPFLPLLVQIILLVSAQCFTVLRQSGSWLYRYRMVTNWPLPTYLNPRWHGTYYHSVLDCYNIILKNIFYRNI